MSARPTVTVFDPTTAESCGTASLPAVFEAPIRPDVVQFVHTNVAKNKRQAYAVSQMAGHQTSAISWGTGRAVSRIPRVNGGGTQRSGQGAFGNMCRSGRMFGPTKTWRRWHRRVNQNQRRFAIASAIAASGVAPLLMARGHRVENVPEVPLVLGNDVESVEKTSKAMAVLARFGADADVEKCKSSRRVRTGKGKMRNRRYVSRRGPLVVYNSTDNLIQRAFRNLPGVQLAHVERLNLLDLAPGGHVGRFIVWTQAAFERLDSIYGTTTEESELKSGYKLPRNQMANTDVARLINSDEIQSVVRPAKRSMREFPRKKNPLKNLGVMVRLNPHAMAVRRAEVRAQAARKAARTTAVSAKRTALKKTRKSLKANRRSWYESASANGDICW